MATVEESVLRVEMAGLESQEVGWDRLGLTVGTNPGLLVSVRRFFHVNGHSDPSDYGEASCGLRMQKVSGRYTG